MVAQANESVMTRSTSPSKNTGSKRAQGTENPAEDWDERAYNADYSFTLQAIMDMQKSVGQLTEAINGLKESSLEQKKTTELLSEKLSGVTHKIYAAGIVLAILVAIGGFIVDKAADLAIEQIKASSAKP
jgi:hypothetical protein